MPGIHPDITTAFGETPLVRLNALTEGLGAEVLAKLEFYNPGSSVKDRLGYALVEAAEAAGELLERLLRYARFRGAAGWLGERKLSGETLLYRAAPLPDELRRLSVEQAEASYDPAVLGAALGGLLRTPPPVDLSHMAMPRVTLGERVAHLRELLRAHSGRFGFDEAVRGADRVTVAVTLFALLELYKRGEASWEQAEPFGPITVAAT